MRIEARGLGKRFGRVEALRDVSFDVPSGQRIAIVGPNGSGKSTLNRVLLGLLRHEGEVWIGGYAAFAERERVARQMAYVPQVAPTLAAPVGEWVQALAQLRGLQPCAVEKVAARLGLGLAGIAERPFRALSGGTRHKVLVALALAAEPALLILDEPTGSLDPVSRERVLALIDELPRTTTVLLCSHRLSEIRQLVEAVIALADGTIASRGPVGAFLDASLVSVIEVAAEPEAAGWLRAHGFRRRTAQAQTSPTSGSGWWVRAVAREEKLALLAELPQRLGPRLHDLCVREGDALALATDEGARREDG